MRLNKSEFVGPSVGMVAWAFALYGSLQVGKIEGNWGHGICGPWGCGPPVQALLACHLFWFVLLSLPVWFTFSRCSARFAHWTGLTMLGTGLSGLATIAVWQAIVWLPLVQSWPKTYVFEHCLFSIATIVDVPVVQLTVLGATLLMAVRFIKSRAADSFATGFDDEDQPFKQPTLKLSTAWRRRLWLGLLILVPATISGGFWWLSRCYASPAIAIVACPHHPTEIEGNCWQAASGYLGGGLPVQALVACHFTWVALLALPVWLLLTRFTVSACYLCGLAMLGIGLSGLAAIALGTAAGWFTFLEGSADEQYLHGYLVSLASMVEAPVTQLAVLGGALLLATRLKRSREARAVSVSKNTMPPAGL